MHPSRNGIVAHAANSAQRQRVNGHPKGHHSEQFIDHNMLRQG